MALCVTDSDPTIVELADEFNPATAKEPEIVSLPVTLSEPTMVTLWVTTSDPVIVEFAVELNPDSAKLPPTPLCDDMLPPMNKFPPIPTPPVTNSAPVAVLVDTVLLVIDTIWTNVD